MLRTACALAVFAAVLVTVPPARPAAQEPSRVDRLLERYVATGDATLIATTFPDYFTFLNWRVEIFTRARAWRESWHPAGVTLLLDLAFWGSRQGWPDAPLILRAAEDIVTGRTAAPGEAPEQDRFELTFHRAALAWLIGARSLVEAGDYARRLEGRVLAEAPAGASDGQLRDPRLALARGTIEEAWTAPGAPGPDGEEDRLPSLMLDPEDEDARAHLEQAIAAFARARALPAVHAEASVRRAFSLHRLGRHEEALAALQELETAVGAEPIVSYWRHLFIGRVFEALERPVEAAEAYRAAMEAWPGAQTPAVALASLLQRQGRAADARDWARLAGAATPRVVDPWWQYWSGDLRFVNQWMADLRRSLP